MTTDLSTADNAKTPAITLHFQPNQTSIIDLNSMSKLMNSMIEVNECDVDQLLSQEIQLALRVAGYSILRRVHVTTMRGIATLQGCVPSYHMKQVAQVSALVVTGVLAVRNELKVSAARPSGRHIPPREL